MVPLLSLVILEVLCRVELFLLQAENTQNMKIHGPGETIPSPPKKKELQKMKY